MITKLYKKTCLLQMKYAQETFRFTLDEFTTFESNLDHPDSSGKCTQLHISQVPPSNMMS